MCEEKGFNGTALVAFLAGGLIGAGIALLTAPVSGREAREKISDLAEDLRLTNAAVREILVHVERVAANVALVSDGGKKIRKGLDLASAGITGILLPVLGGVSGVTAGARAFVETLVRRNSRKEEEDHV